MIQRIAVWDENRVKIGDTFPKRAKQLVAKKRAIWLDETHTEILLLPAKEGGLDMDAQDVGNADMFAKDLLKEKSIIKDAYRDSAYVVLGSTPVEIITKSKKRTRELHTAFSLVLWTGTAILYFAVNYLLGNRGMTLNPFEMSGTWLVFVFAALIECFVEVYFCKKELAVLNENIDLRQINPSKDDDLDLRGYQKKLIRKIKLMSSAVLWVPLVIIYFISGYVFGLWGIAWIVFVFGLFFELLRNFVSKLKAKTD